MTCNGYGYKGEKTGGEAGVPGLGKMVAVLFYFLK